MIENFGCFSEQLFQIDALLRVSCFVLPRACLLGNFVQVVVASFHSNPSWLFSSNVWVFVFDVTYSFLSSRQMYLLNWKREKVIVAAKNLIQFCRHGLGLTRSALCSRLAPDKLVTFSALLHFCNQFEQVISVPFGADNGWCFLLRILTYLRQRSRMLCPLH